MNLIYLLVLSSAFLFGGVAVAALVWAIRGGQFDNMQRGATSIFDPDEPIGRRTDAFPDAHPSDKRSRSTD